MVGHGALVVFIHTITVVSVQLKPADRPEDRAKVAWSDEKGGVG